ncbi:unnamed protein product, partial [Nesidiocoris tenuis]
MENTLFDLCYKLIKQHCRINLLAILWAMISTRVTQIRAWDFLDGELEPMNK